MNRVRNLAIVCVTACLGWLSVLGPLAGLTSLAGLISIAGLTSLAGCTSRAGSNHPIDARETLGMVVNGFAVVVDVREEDELTEGMVQGARWFPMSKASDEAEWKRFVASLPKDKTIVTYCASGGRAGIIGDQLAAEGFKARNMGGFDDWVAAGNPVQPKP